MEDASPAQIVPEPWTNEFKAFDEEWSERNDRRRSTVGGVRETYYSAGHKAGAAAADADLLAACQAVVVAITHNADSGQSDCDCDGDCEVAFALWTEAETLLKTAIAGARGEANDARE